MSDPSEEEAGRLAAESLAGGDATGGLAPVRTERIDGRWRAELRR